MIEDIHIVKSHTHQALIQAGQQIFAAAPVAVRAVPHIKVSFGADQRVRPDRDEKAS